MDQDHEAKTSSPISDVAVNLSNISLDAITDQKPKPSLVSLPHEILIMILSYALRESHGTCYLDRPRLPPPCHVCRLLREVAMPIYLWSNDWSITLRSRQSKGQGQGQVSFSLQSSGLHDTAATATFDAIPKTAPLFRRFRVWGDARLGGPFLAFSIHRGQPRVEHGSPCALCGGWPLEVVRPERSHDDEWVLAWERRKAKHRRRLVELGGLLYQGLQVEGKGFSVQVLREVVRRVKGDALRRIKQSSEEVGKVRRLYKVLFVVKDEWTPASP